MKTNTTINAHSKFHDDQLHRLALAFGDLPELEWTAGPFGDGIIDGETRAGNLLANIGKEGGPKHIQNAPYSSKYCVRFVFRRARVYLAFAKQDRLDELMRFADALTHELWPYRERGAHSPIKEGAFNFSLKETEIDLEEWRLNRPDVIELIQQIIERLRELDLIRLPAERAIQRHEDGVHSYARTRTLSGKVESLLAYQTGALSELLDEKILAVQNVTGRIVGLIEAQNRRLDELESRLEAASLRVVPSSQPEVNQSPIVMPTFDEVKPDVNRK